MARQRRLSGEERAELITRGYQRFELWLPDLHDPETRALAEAESRRIAFDDDEDEIVGWVEGVQRDGAVSTAESAAAGAKILQIAAVETARITE